MTEPATPSLAARIVRVMEERGHRLDKGDGEINIVYVEGLSPDGTPNRNEPNRFNDLRLILRFVGGRPEIVRSWEATTEPGRYYTDHPLNTQGAARIALGQHLGAWQVGVHRESHEALVQTGAALTVCRDTNRDFKRDGDVRDTGFFGINQHWGYDAPTDDIGKASAGCLVGRTTEGHREFMDLVKSDRRYRADHQFHFSTTVLTAVDVGAVGPRTSSAPVGAVTEGQRLRMAKAIVDFEARRDVQGRLAVYDLPPGDGGGRYEVAGINERYHKTEADHAVALIRAGRFREAEDYVTGVIADLTDVVAGWCGDIGVEFYLRDCAFNRGPTGAARILQRAVGVTEDGIVGPITRSTAAAVAPRQLLQRLRVARESYEQDPVGRDESSPFWRGLENRWNKALALALRFLEERPAPERRTPSTPVPVDRAALIAEIVAAIEHVFRNLRERRMSDTTPSTAGQRIDLAALQQLIGMLDQINTAGAGVRPVPAGTTPILSPIDKALGGEAMVGLKTPLAIGAYVLMWVMQSFGAVGTATGDKATTTGSVLTALIAAFGGLGLTAKFDRAFKAVGTIAALLQKLSTVVPPAPRP